MTCKYDFMAVDKLVRSECKAFFGKYDIASFYKDMFDELNKRLNIYDLEPKVEGECGRSHNQLQMVIISILEAVIEEALMTNSIVYAFLQKKVAKNDEKTKDASPKDAWLNRINAEDMRWARQYMYDRVKRFFGIAEFDAFCNQLFDKIDKIIPITDMDIGNDDSPVFLVFSIIKESISLYVGVSVYVPAILKAEVQYRFKR